MLWLLILNPLFLLHLFIHQHPLTIAGLSLLRVAPGDLWPECQLTFQLWKWSGTELNQQSNKWVIKSTFCFPQCATKLFVLLPNQFLCMQLPWFYISTIYISLNLHFPHLSFTVSHIDVIDIKITVTMGIHFGMMLHGACTLFCVYHEILQFRLWPLVLSFVILCVYILSVTFLFVLSL